MSERYVPMTYFKDLEDARLTLREESLLALEKQIDYMEWLKTSPAESFFDHFTATYGGKKIAGLDRTGLGRALRNNVEQIVGESPTYYVSRDMTEMIKMAAEDVPRDGVSPADLLTGSGFLYFHHQVDVEGALEGLPEEAKDGATALAEGNFSPSAGKTQDVGIRAIAWDQTDVQTAKGLVPGVCYYLFMDPEYLAAMDLHDDAQKLTPTDMLRGLVEEQGLELAEPITHMIPESVRKAYLQEWKTKAGPLVLYDFSGWSYGRAWEVVPWDEPARPDTEVQGVHPVVDQARRLLLATWSMLNQKIVSLSPARPPRAMRRRAGRVMPETGDVVVVRLRKEYHPEGSEEQALANQADPDAEPWFNHRFLVRGHWRRQPYGEGRSETKLIWIAPHVRGPDDRPLIIKSKIWSLEQ